MRAFLFNAILLTLIGCSASKLKRLQTCEYSFQGISEVLIAGEKLEDLNTDKKSGFMGSSVLSKLLFQKEVPVNFNVQIKIKNPNTKTAALDKIEWTACMKDKEFLSGVYNQHFEVKPGETAVLSVPVSFDLKKQLSGENGAAIKSFGMGYLLNGKIQGISIKVRPYIGALKFPKSFEIKP